jgi:hypothetical protein
LISFVPSKRLILFFSLVTWAGGTGYRKFFKKLFHNLPDLNLDSFSTFRMAFLGGEGGGQQVNYWGHFYDVLVGDDFTQFDNEGESFWFSLTAHVFLPQRSSVYSYPAALFIFVLLMRSRTQSIVPSFDNSSCFLSIFI